MSDRERKLYEDRTDTFLKYITELIYEETHELHIEYCMFDPMVPFEQRLEGTYKPLSLNRSWGRDWQRGWFHLTDRIPEEWAGKEIVARISMGSEALVFDGQGIPSGALSIHSLWGGQDFRRDRLRLYQEAKGGETIDLWMECSASQLLGLSIHNDRGIDIPEKFGTYEASVEYAEIAVFRNDIWQFLQDVRVLQSLMLALQENSVRRARILNALNRAIDVFTPSEKDVATARTVLKAELVRKSSSSDLTTMAVGHAHIDTAWLWPVEETIRKCARTFAAQIDLLNRYPGYVFGASMPQHYQFVKDHYPGLYARIKERVREGRWEPQGGMWVEADCNLIGGESMVRQILYGKRFYRKEFGFEVTNLWLPDVFGYSAAMPQILKKCGIDYMVTQKLSWSQFNRFPHNTFLWRGIDGTEIITHFPPEDNYNSDLSPRGLVRARENFREKALLDTFLSLFGMGDGGGGATEEMLESGIRQKDLEGTPRVEFAPARKFLDQLGRESHKLPRWVGELYLEFHRGTFTTHAYNKKMNRRMESRLRALEMLCVALPARDYPSGALDRIWETVLLFQFHDIIPGSSVTPVYEHCRQEYPKLEAEVTELVQTGGANIFNKDPDTMVVLNTLSESFKRPLALPDSWKGYGVEAGNGAELAIQWEDDVPVVQTDIPALESVTLRKVTAGKPAMQKPPSGFILENRQIRYEFDDSGALSRIFDKTCEKEVLVPGQPGNRLTLYEDRPVGWDAWDIDIFYEKQFRETAQLQRREWIACGPVRQGIRHELTVGRSRIVQEIYLSANSKRLDFVTRVHWQEDHKMLRTAFPVTVKADQATFEIQYGTVQRPTHRNTSWDMAKFEVVGHRYADLSDFDYGVALLNDSKYGYKILDHIIDLNLLRAPSMPDPTADRGEHRFTYSLLPHKGHFMESEVISEALQLNHPPLMFENLTTDSFCFPVRMSSSDVVLEVLKKAEDDDSIIVRCYEPRGRRATARLQMNTDYEYIAETDLLETETARLAAPGNNVTLSFKPFEIKTLKIKK